MLHEPTRAYRILSDPRKSLLFPLLLLHILVLAATFLAPAPYKSIALKILLSLMALLTLVTLLLVAYAWRITKRALLASQCMRCPQCFYDRSSSASEIDTCSECGFQMELQRITEHWQRYLKNPIFHTMFNPFYR